MYNFFMKVFKYRFSRLVLSLIIICLALCAAAFAVNLWQIIKDVAEQTPMDTFRILRYIVMSIVTVVLFAILISLLISSRYVVDGTTLKTCFGFIASKYDITRIDSILLDRKTNKLSAVFKDETFIVIVVRPEWYSDFVQAILDVNPSIEYSINSMTSEDGDKKDKQ